MRDQGLLQEITAARQAAGEARLAEAVRVARLSGDHVWTAIVQHMVTDPARFAEGGGLLDAESVIGMYLGCYVCEEPYDARLAKRRCKGEPH